MSTSPPLARPGRPRSAATDRAILDAARALLAERGYSDLTIEGVAQRAGVAKTTVYRRWPAKADLVVDAVVDTLRPVLEAADDADPLALLRTLADTLGRPESRAAFLALMAEAVTDPLVRTAVDRRLVEPSRAVVRRCAEKQGSELDDDLLFDVVAGAVVHRVLVRGEAADDRFLAGLLDLVRP